MSLLIFVIHPAAYTLMKTRLLLLLAALCVSTSVHAVVNVNGPQGNTSAPTGTGGQPTDPGWANVGVVNGSTGVYLGNGWVLTAGHVGTGSFTTGTGGSYSWDGVNSHSFAGTDMTLFKLEETPSELAAVVLATGSPANGQEVVMIGNGLTAQSLLSPYYVDTESDPWTWSTTDFPEADEIFEGYLSANSGRDIRWGTNVIDGHGYDEEGLGYYFYTTFDLEGGTIYEAQAVTHDSGGAAYWYDGTQWVLAGLMVAVGNYEGQPGGTSSAFGGDLTYMVDLSRYADEINALVPEPSAWATLTGLAALLGVFVVRRRR
jgi:hypothetical protein